MQLQEIYERMHSGQLYRCSNEELLAAQLQCLEKLYAFNATRPSEQEKRQAMLKDMLAELGDNCYIEPPLHANWGGKFVHFGSNVYANFNLTLVDDTHIYVGDAVMIAPNVTIAAGTHPISPQMRREQAQYNLPVRIGNNVWIGAGAVVLPGVTIGENSVIGAGSVVTKDIPANVVSVGNPCRVVREIGAQDSQYYRKDMAIDI
ncbi:MAG: sugar O-acetyltransferase [Clostridiales bacterium]|nr:sugar O-acetyltransferase [Clostridiales bacterium]